MYIVNLKMQNDNKKIENQLKMIKKAVKLGSVSETKTKAPLWAAMLYKLCVNLHTVVFIIHYQPVTFREEDQFQLGDPNKQETGAISHTGVSDVLRSCKHETDFRRWCPAHHGSTFFLSSLPPFIFLTLPHTHTHAHTHALGGCVLEC